MKLCWFIALLFYLTISTCSILQRYYTWDPKFAAKDEARASILVTIRDKLRRTLADDKRRADKIKLKVGGTFAQHRPPYMKPDVWSRIAEYWDSDEFKIKSDAGKKARKAVKVPHTSGARSFDRRRRVCYCITIFDLHLLC